MNARNIKRHSVRHARLDDITRRPLSRAFKAMSEAEIRARARSDPDADLTPADFWKGAELAQLVPGGKDQVTLRIDRDVLSWFKKTGRGYQSRMNAVLRHFMHVRQSGH